jgi:V/A-type H+/Na+-transporting ATPase subunit C
MSSVTKYSALAGKTRAMFGRILKEADYRAIMGKDGVSGIAEYLKHETHYAAELADTDEGTIHRGRLEVLLKHSLMKDYEKLAVFSQGTLRGFVHTVYKKHEIESLKLLFRAFAAGNVPPETLEESLLFLSRYDRLNIPKLALSKDAAEFVGNLQGTEYYRILRTYLEEPGTFPLFQIEMALDSFYYNEIGYALRHILAGEDAEIAKELYGSEIDLFNLMTVYRCKVFYHMDRDVVNSYWVDNRHRITQDIRTRMLDAPDRETLLEILSGTPYAEVFRNGDERLFDIEVQEWLYRRHYRQFQQKVFTIACMLSYLRIRDTEIRNVITLIECARYRLPEEQQISYLIGWKAS